MRSGLYSLLICYQSFDKRGISYAVIRRYHNDMLKITPDFIPHMEFHKGVWLLSVSRPYWYYFMKKQNRNTITNKQFITSVDEPLKELVKFLHRKGIKTTPSCSGHHMSEKDFEKIYDALKIDEEEIKNGGMKLQDVETGKEYLFRKEGYCLPWEKDSFLKEVITYQQKGVIGIRMGNKKKLKEKILALKMDEVTIKEADSIIFICTAKDEKGENRQTWKRVTKEIKRIFKESLNTRVSKQSRNFKLKT